MQCKTARNLFGIVIVCYLTCYGASALALDNPDAPNYVNEFLNRAQAHEAGIRRATHSTQGYAASYTAYENFLDEEINKVYNLLMGHLDRDTQQALRDSQRKWLKYRDAEFEFIALNWTAKNFGSSVVISRGDYRTTIIKDRIMLLLHYLQNYSP